MPDVRIPDLENYVREVQSAAERSFQSLASKQHTSALLHAELARSRSFGAGAGRLIALLKANAPSGKTDGGDLVLAFECARDTVRSIYDLVSAEHRQATNDPVRTADTVSTYAALVAASAALHDRLNELAWLVGEHEADADEKLPGTFSSVEGLLHAMGS